MLASLLRWLPLSKSLRGPALAALLLALLGSAAARTAATSRAAKASATYTVTATAYEAVPGQTDSKPFLTADNSRIPRHYGSHTRWLALSRDLLRPWGGPFAFGEKVRVEGISPALDGEYTIHDTMHPRFRHRLDVLVHPREHLSLARTGVKLRRIGAAAPRTNAVRTRPQPAGKPSKAAVRRPRKAQPRPRLAPKPLATRQALKRRKPALAANPAKAARTHAKLSQARRPAAPVRPKARAAKQLAASPKPSRQRRAARLVAHR